MVLLVIALPRISPVVHPIWPYVLFYIGFIWVGKLLWSEAKQRSWRFQRRCWGFFAKSRIKLKIDLLLLLTYVQYCNKTVIFQRDLQSQLLRCHTVGILRFHHHRCTTHAHMHGSRLPGDPLSHRGGRAVGTENPFGSVCVDTQRTHSVRGQQQGRRDVAHVKPQCRGVAN